MLSWRCGTRRRRSRTQGSGSAPGRTRAVSACATRATRLARTRKRALSLVAHQCKLSHTACDRSGTRRVGRARRGGAGRPCSANACEEGPPPKGVQELNQLHKCPGLRRNPWQWYEPAGPTGDRHDAHVASMEHVYHRDGASASHMGARTARRGPQARESCARKRAVGIFFRGGIKKRVYNSPLVPSAPGARPRTPKGAAPRPNPTNHPRSARPR